MPIVLGQTQEAAQKKMGGSVPGKRHWDDASFMAELSRVFPTQPEITAVARELMAWARQNADRVDFNSNPNWGSFDPIMIRDEAALPGPFRVWTDGSVAVSFQYMLGRPVFSDPTLREDLRSRLNAIPGIALREDAISKRPTITLATLASPGTLPAFLAVIDWFVATFRGQGS